MISVLCTVTIKQDPIVWDQLQIGGTVMQKVKSEPKPPVLIQKTDVIKKGGQSFIVLTPLKINDTAKTEPKTRTVQTYKPTTDQQLKISKIEHGIRHGHNMTELLLSSNATPIRAYEGVNYLCLFCKERYPKPEDLKNHTLTQHSSEQIRNALKKECSKSMDYFYLKIDITSLKCRHCFQNMDTHEQLMEHLVNKHNKKFYTDIKNQIVPFKFDSDLIRCFICSNVFYKFKTLLEHLHGHYRNYECNFCESGYITRAALGRHMEGHKTGTFKCNFCERVFDTLRKKRTHSRTHAISNYPKTNKYKCGHCSETFPYFRTKEVHMLTEHGVGAAGYPCQACDRKFRIRKSLAIHMKKDHLLERKHVCSYCKKAFFGSNELKMHLLKHTGERSFKCDVCLKAFGRKKTLIYHIRIHNDDRRYKCEHCGQAFIQRTSWRGHLKSKHGQIV